MVRYKYYIFRVEIIYYILQFSKNIIIVEINKKRGCLHFSETPSFFNIRTQLYSLGLEEFTFFNTRLLTN